MNVRLLACGECGVLVEVADLAEVLALDGAIRPLVESRDDGWRTVVDLVPATRTLLVTVRTPKALEPVTRHILAVAADLDDIAAHPGETDTIDIGVVYDGPDLDDVAVIDAVARIMPIMTALYLVSGPLMMIGGYFQAIGDARRAAALGLTKPYLFTLPLIALLTSTFGESGLDAFLAKTDILIGLLPLTPDTKGIFNTGLFSRLSRKGPFGAPVFINAGRGGSQVEADIVASINDGTLRGASLDVFELEPLTVSFKVDVALFAAVVTSPG